MSVLHLQGEIIVPGEASGAVLVSQEPLSFWGGYDQTSGEIIDRRHPLSGQFAGGRILAIPATRGSSTTTAVLLEAIRANTAPIAFITRGTDHFLALASIVAEEMYGQAIPIVSLNAQAFEQLESGQWVVIGTNGFVNIESMAHGKEIDK